MLFVLSLHCTVYHIAFDNLPNNVAIVNSCTYIGTIVALLLVKNASNDDSLIEACQISNYNAV